MRLLKSNLNFKRVLPQVVIGIGASLCLASIAEAAVINAVKGNASTTVPTSNTIQIAQESSACPDSSGGSQFVSAETKNFLVYICGGDNPNTYVGVAKNGGNGITLPLQSYTRDRFVAVNGDTRYTLTRTELVVTQKGKVIARERAQWKR